MLTQHSTSQFEPLDSPLNLDDPNHESTMHEDYQHDPLNENAQQHILPDPPEIPAHDDALLPRRMRPQPGFYKTLAGYAPKGTAANATHLDTDDHLPMFALHASSIGMEPCTITQALSGPDANQWQKAYQIELDQLNCACTWDIVDRPPDKPVIPCGYVFKLKLGPNGEILKYKAQVVAGGHRQTKGTNYNETFAAMAKIASI